MDRLIAMRAFSRLVELGTFSAVARELRVKQSTVSKWVARVEQELGVALLERTTRTMRVTEAGQLYYARAREILGAYDAVVAELQEETTVLQGRIRVSVPVVFGRMYVLPLLVDFLALHESLEVELVYSDRYVNLVEEGFDVAIRVGVPTDTSSRARKLGETGRFLVASPEYVAAHGAPTTPQDLRAHECLLHTQLQRGDTWVFGQSERVLRTQVRGRISANNSEALRAMALRGLGVALLASWLVEEDLAGGALVALLPEYSLPGAPISALVSPGRYIHPRVRCFLEFLVEGFRVHPSFGLRAHDQVV